ncbi:protein mono-ADP-ribosyltransferase PARP3-like isoform X2 [Panulirus ornatus]|uniref:protein mono-ADP-ribosyltransferase PARP3-like isoform X2 n=1 Tax=Panulirus ornatus TaxID=150431 RepID=UPI003A8864A1
MGDRDSTAKRKRSISDLPAIPKRPQLENGETRHTPGSHKGKRRPIPDAVLRSRSKRVKVHEDFSCRLRFTDDNNCSKFFIMQVVICNNKFGVFTRWGQEGEEGEWEAKKENGVKEAIRTFKKKFREKTDNGWDKRDTFLPQPGKFYLQEDEEDGEIDNEEDKEASDAEMEMQPLNPRTELMLRLVLDRKMFMKQISVMKLDPRKMIPEKITERLLSKAEEALLGIERALKARMPSSTLSELWCKFFKAVPHLDKSLVGPPQQVGEAAETFLHKKKELMGILSDMRLMWNLLEQDRETEDLDPQEQYELLGCRLRLIDKDGEEYKMVEEYSKACKNSRQCTLLDVWSINRAEEKARYDEYAGLHYRKLLWHGVNVACVAAILKYGLRITQFSGGNLGKGLYFTPEHAKSSWNVGVHWGTYEGERNVGFMFLVETALGRMKYIKMGNSSLCQPPEGFNSIAAKGRLEPDPSKDKIIMLDDMRVFVPVGQPEPQREFEASGFLDRINNFRRTDRNHYKYDAARVRETNNS